MATKEKHIEIAQRHKYFIKFTCQTVKQHPSKCAPEVFCVWIVMASYYRAIHLLEAIFDKYGFGHAIPTNDEDADKRRKVLLRKLDMSRIREECKHLRRFALHAKYFTDDPAFDYDVVTQLDMTQKWVVDGVLARIEALVASALEAKVEDI